MRRVPYLEDLLTFLSQSPILNGHGLFDQNGRPIIDINGSNIFVMAEYKMIHELNNKSHHVLLIPLKTKIKAPDSKSNTCKAIGEHYFMICCVTMNLRNPNQHFQVNCPVPGGPMNLTGAYVDAAHLENLVRQTVLDFNSTQFNLNPNKTYSPFQLLELPEPEEHNGHLIHKQIYCTSYTF